MGFYIGTNGKIYKEGADRPAYNLERMGILNWFHSRFSATAIRDIIEDFHPRAFMNK